jgi:hypothetical protein
MVLAAVVGMVCARGVRAETVYEQAPLLGNDMVTPATFFDAAESPTADMTSTSGFYHSSYADNFILGSTATVSTLGWTGYIENSPGLTTTDSNIAGFRIDFYVRSFDPYQLAETPLYTQYVALADAHPVVTEGTNSYGTTTYTFSAGLATPQVFVGGQEYFVAINADLKDVNESSYFWSAAATVADAEPATIAVNGHAPTNGYSYAVEWNGQFADPDIGYSGVSGLHDLAFTLANDAAPAGGGTAAPLPASVWGGLGMLAAMAGVKMRRRVRGA